MSNMREQLLAKTSGIRSTSSIKDNEVKRGERTQTAPGIAGALAVAQIRVQELEAAGASSMVAVDKIVPNPWQPRKVFSEAKLAELAESIREVGLMQPVVVRRVDEVYQMIAGERRWRAHKMLGLREIKTVVVECTDQDMAVLALVENISRDDLADYEIALSIQESSKEFPTRARLAEALGLSKQGLHRFLAFTKLPAFIQRDLAINPRLLGGNAAESLAAVLSKHGDAALNAAEELWPSLKAGTLEQRQLAPTVAATAAASGSKGTTSSAARERSIEKFFAGKKQAGSITKDVSSFTIKIRAGALSDAQEVRLRSLISELFSEGPSKD